MSEFEDSILPLYDLKQRAKTPDGRLIGDARLAEANPATAQSLDHTPATSILIRLRQKIYNRLRGIK